MDPAVLTIAIKGAGMITQIVGGVTALRYGYRVFTMKGQSRGAEIAFEIGTFKATGRSVGSVVMLTAGLWAWLGVLINPSYKKSEDAIEIYSFETSQGTVTAAALVAAVSHGEEDAVIEDPERLRTAFSRAIYGSNSTATLLQAFKVDGRPAVVDLFSIRTLDAPNHVHDVATNIRSTRDSATLSYRPERHQGGITFRPIGVVEVAPVSAEVAPLSGSRGADDKRFAGREDIPE